MGEFVSMVDFNGLGSRVNSLSESHAELKGNTLQHLESLDKIAENQLVTNKELFSGMSRINSNISKMMGGIAVLMVVLQISFFVVGKVWK